jgi:diguanylate cyclase (GGDEF)-like protein
MWKSARSFAGKPAPLIIALLGAAIVGLAPVVAGTRELTSELSLSAGAAYLFSAALSLWRAREERLAARFPIIVLTTVHAGVLSVGAGTTLTGSLAPGELATVMSLFGLIHFETIVFMLGSAVFILALVKERNEAASHRVSRLDPLTGIANRAAFMESAGRVMEQCRREDTPVSVMMYDLDRFKLINDTHGHATGDAVIRKFCEVVASALRPNDVFGRLGGEEFAAVLPRLSIEAACVRAERMRAICVEHCRVINGHQVDATVSCGVAASDDAEIALNDLLELADRALYRAKAEGRNRVKRADQDASKPSLSTVIRVA